VPTDRAPSLFFSCPSLRMSPVVSVRTIAAQWVWPQPSVSTFDPPLRLERLVQELNAATWRTRTGSLLPFNILASPLAAAARGIDMRSSFRLAPFRSARLGTLRHGTARYDPAQHAVLFARLVTSDWTFSFGVLSNEYATRHPISIGMRRIDLLRVRPVYSVIDPATIEPHWPLTVWEVVHSDRFARTDFERILL